MGKNPAAREKKAMKPVDRSTGFEPRVPCGACGAASRRLRPQWRVCENGHQFVRKTR